MPACPGEQERGVTLLERGSRDVEVIDAGRSRCGPGDVIGMTSPLRPPR
jgi:hypothetical protein